MAQEQQFQRGGVEFEFFRGRPDPSHDLFRSAHVSHIYIFYKSNKVIIIENWTVSHCAVLLNYFKVMDYVYVEREVTLAKNFRTVYALFHTLLPSSTSVAAA